MAFDEFMCNQPERPRAVLTSVVQPGTRSVLRASCGPTAAARPRPCLALWPPQKSQGTGSRRPSSPTAADRTSETRPHGVGSIPSKRAFPPAHCRSGCSSLTHIQPSGRSARAASANTGARSSMCSRTRLGRHDRCVCVPGRVDDLVVGGGPGIVGDSGGGAGHGSRYGPLSQPATEAMASSASMTSALGPVKASSTRRCHASP